MGFFEIVMLGAALSADAFAVTASNACMHAGERRGRLFLMPVLFGLFQGLMPVCGYLLGEVAAGPIERFSGIVTLAILGTIGVGMIVDGVREWRETAVEACGTAGPLSVGAIVFQAVATAIDAFAVGVTLSAAGVAIIPAALTICIVTCVFCIVALHIGIKLGRVLGNMAKIAGGIVLLLIGLKACFL